MGLHGKQRAANHSFLEILLQFTPQLQFGARLKRSIKVSSGSVSDVITLYKVSDGAAAKSLEIMADGYTMVTNSSGVTAPNYITLTAKKQNTTSNVTWSSSPSVALFPAPTGGTAVTTGDVVYIRKGDLLAAAGKSTTITATLADGGATFTDKNHSLCSNRGARGFNGG